MLVATTIIIIAALAGFAILHALGGSLMTRASDLPTREATHLDRAD
jgi:uncharacterized membrane protein